jgi:peptidoglycan/LPS O-acetylase OafA/YrhL
VNLFFILSGFVLYAPYTGTDKTQFSAIDFWIKRFFRLYPLLIVSLLVTILWRSSLSNKEWTSVILSITNFSIFTKDYFFCSLNPALWSLSLEIGFAILFPLIVFLFQRINPWRTLAIIAIISLVVRFLGLSYVTGDWFGVNFLKDSFPARLDDFVVGMTLAYVVRNGLYKGLNDKVLLLVTLVTITVSIFVYNLWENPRKLSILFMPFTSNLIQIGFSALVLSAMSFKSWVSRLFSLRTFTAIGLVCFPLYLWQLPLYENFVQTNLYRDFFLLCGIKPALGTVTSVILFYILLICISVLSYAWIEKPGVWLGRLIIKKRLGIAGKKRTSTTVS